MPRYKTAEERRQAHLERTRKYMKDYGPKRNKARRERKVDNERRRDGKLAN